MWGRTTRNSRCWDLQKLADRLDDCIGIRTRGEPVARLTKAILTIEQGPAHGEGRTDISCISAGMFTREPLLEKMRVDGRGVLGIIQLLDFDRLCAFDPAAGEALMQLVASRLQAMLPPSRLLARVDRAHLAIWFGKDASEDAASSELEAIKYALGETVQIGDQMILPEASTQIVACFGENGSTVLAQLLARSALAANSIYPTAQLKDPDLDQGESFSFEQDLRFAITRGEMRLCYQPIIDAAAARICGVEALARWQSPRRGAVSPALFVPVLEAIGLAHELGMWALNMAARDVRDWQERQLGGLRVAVNVSGHQLEHDDLPMLIARTMSRHGLPPDCLEIELTEGVATADCDRAARLFSQIRAMGVTIAIDDFGTGYSSLSTLRKLAFDKIKIDREFVTEVDRRKDSQAICQSIIALARGLGIRVLAEGVERPEEYAWLRQHGCNLYQGFYFAPPLEPNAFFGFAKNPLGLSAKLALDARALQNDIAARLSA